MKKFFVFVLVFGYSWAMHYDEDGVRYTQWRKGEGINWVLVPGGPGCDAKYMEGVAELLPDEGSVWLIDMPGNGTNQKSDKDYSNWLEIFPKVIESFENCIVIGHSFGGFLTMLSPELEHHLKGVVFLNTAPKHWKEASEKFVKDRDLPSFEKAAKVYGDNPSNETLSHALVELAPHYFAPEHLEKGRKAMKKIYFEHRVRDYWGQRLTDMNYRATWVPQKVPTLIISGAFDGATPAILFREDHRFKRKNIEIVDLPRSGHFSWVDAPSEVRDLLARFAKRIEK